MNGSTNALPLAITCGDPAGVGPEVIEGALGNDALKGSDCVLIGPKGWTDRLKTEFGLGVRVVGEATFAFEPGRPSEKSAALALTALEVAASGCREGLYRGVVTGPVSKHWLQKAGFSHPGQTEFFAAAWEGDPTMGFVGGELKVVLATWHIPLRAVAAALTPACLERAVRAADDLARSLGNLEPKIGVCGLNPHAGEGGLLGDEELMVLDPALDKLRDEFPGLSKCLPGDTVFHRQRRGDFDVVVAAYHDQALAAVKTLEFDRAVNVTLGLPYLRTSPDHGTAFEIAGEGIADSSSFLAALELARRLTDSAI
ncbi:MAG: 4-hydroxythreonine-4-phosphate dehydrogenase PdxA [Verrucomicrobiota bacterium]